MRYIKVETVGGPLSGYSLDADEYLRVLADIEADLPEGARRFALDEEHYNFFGIRCVKDLKLSSATLSDAIDQVSLRLEFAANKFKHDQGLTIKYINVVEFAVDVTAAPKKDNIWPESRRLGDFQLDEILPYENGVSHEIKLTGGVVRIIASDLFAEWRDDVTSAVSRDGGNEGQVE